MPDQPPAPPAPPAERAGRLLDAGWDRLSTIPAAALVVGLLGLAVLRSGVALGRSDLRAVLVITEAFPTPVLDWRANSVLPYGLAHVAQVTEPWQWFALHAVLVAVVAAVAVATTVRRFATPAARRLAGTWLSVGSVPPVLLQRIGSYDPYSVAGALLVVFGPHVGGAVLGGVLVGLTSAEQGALGLGAALVVVAVLAAHDGVEGRLRDRLRGLPVVRRLVAAAAGLVVARVAVLAWFASQGADVPSRGSILGDLAGDSLVNALSAGTSGAYAWLGLGWGLLVVGWVVGGWRRATVVQVVAAVVVPGAVAASITLDGTRVFVAVSLPAVLVLLGWIVDRVDRLPAVDARLVHRITVAVLVAAPLVPALVAEPSGGTYFPFPWGR